MSARNRKRRGASRRTVRDEPAPMGAVDPDAEARSRRRRRLLRRGWPWPLIALATLWGALAMGLSGALIIGGVGTMLYGMASEAYVFIGPDQRWHIRAALVCCVLGLAALLTGGYIGGSRLAAPSDLPSPTVSTSPSPAR